MRELNQPRERFLWIALLALHMPAIWCRMFILDLPRQKWLQDRPDWVVGFLYRAAHTDDGELVPCTPDMRALSLQARAEWEFRRAIQVAAPAAKGAST